MCVCVCVYRCRFGAVLAFANDADDCLGACVAAELVRYDACVPCRQVFACIVLCRPGDAAEKIVCSVFGLASHPLSICLRLLFKLLLNPK